MKQHSEFDVKIMRILIGEAGKRKGATWPNPCVAAAVVANQEVLSLGVHQKAGEPHAEVLALDESGPDARGATLYITLEPCTHWGRTPPCCEKIINAGISKVVYGIRDNDFRVREKPADVVLKKAGIEVISPVLERECLELNEEYFKYKSMQLPFISIKAGMSLDGRIALANKKSKYITSAESLMYTHQLRREHQAILIGINTALIDNPSLNVRYQKKQEDFFDPCKVILDPELSLPPEANLFKDTNKEKVVVFTSKNSLKLKKCSVLSKKAEVVAVPEGPKWLDWEAVLETLYKKGIGSVLIEGGSYVLASAVEAGIVDKAYFFIAPKLLMGQNSLSVVNGNDPDSLEDLPELTHTEVLKLGKDILIYGYFNHPDRWFKGNIF